MIGTWVSGQGLSSQAMTAHGIFSSCANIQWTVTSQTATQAVGRFAAVCSGLNVVGTITGTLGGATVPLVFTGTATQGSTICPFTLNGVGAPLGSDTFRIDYTGTSCLGPIQGSETLRLASSAPASPAPAPAPAPVPTPAPVAPPAPTGGEPVDLHQVTITGGSAANVADWPITTTIRAMDFNAGGVALDFSKKDGAGRWPDVTPPGWDGPLQYTIWMIVSHGGRLYTSGGVEFWHGLARSGGPPSRYAANWYYTPQVWGALASHQPAVGEQVGFFVTAGDQRAKDVRSVSERSNIVVVHFPSDAGGYFPF
jgi:hypothetical protein